MSLVKIFDQGRTVSRLPYKRITQSRPEHGMLSNSSIELVHSNLLIILFIIFINTVH